MPFLDKQVDILNKCLSTALLSDKRFAGGALHGLAEQTLSIDQEGVETRFPFTMNDQGEPENVSFDDTYPIMIYHIRASDSTIEEAEDSSFGDDTELMEIQPMSLVIFGKGSSLKLSSEQIKSFITLAMPTEISPVLLTGIQIDKMRTLPTGSKMKSIDVFSEEYQGIEYPLDQTDFLIKLNYTITSYFRRECVDICDC